MNLYFIPKNDNIVIISFWGELYMDKIIFLDIDGVLNSCNTFIENKIVKNLYSKCLDRTYMNDLKWLLLDIDFEKLQLLKQIVDITDAKIVISSSWKKLRLYPLVEEYLIQKGIPIIGTTKNIKSERGKEIKTYIEENMINDFIVIDDEIFDDYDDLIINRLIKTDFYQNGLDEEHVEEAVKILKPRKNKTHML